MSMAIIFITQKLIETEEVHYDTSGIIRFSNGFFILFKTPLEESFSSSREKSSFCRSLPLCLYNGNPIFG